MLFQLLEDVIEVYFVVLGQECRLLRPVYYGRI